MKLLALCANKKSWTQWTRNNFFFE